MRRGLRGGVGCSAGGTGRRERVPGPGRRGRPCAVVRGHGEGALVLARGDEREAALDIEGREGRRSSRSSRDQGAARLEGAIVEEDGDDRWRRGGDPARERSDEVQAGRRGRRATVMVSQWGGGVVSLLFFSGSF